VVTVSPKPRLKGVPTHRTVGARGFEPLTSSASKIDARRLDQRIRWLRPHSDVRQVSPSTFGFRRLLD
jgi:hypothetical protein